MLILRFESRSITNRRDLDNCYQVGVARRHCRSAVDSDASSDSNDVVVQDTRNCFA